MFMLCSLVIFESLLSKVLIVVALVSTRALLKSIPLVSTRGFLFCTKFEFNLSVTGEVWFNGLQQGMVNPSLHWGFLIFELYFTCFSVISMLTAATVFTVARFF